MKLRTTTRKPESLVFVVPSEIYPFKVVFWLGPRPEDKQVGQLAKRLKLWSGEGKCPTVGDGRAACVHFVNGDIVWVAPCKSVSEFYGRLNHELVHLLNSLADTIGEPQKYFHDELFAYFAGWLMEKFHDRIAKSNYPLC